MGLLKELPQVQNNFGPPFISKLSISFQNNKKQKRSLNNNISYVSFLKFKKGQWVAKKREGILEEILDTHKLIQELKRKDIKKEALHDTKKNRGFRGKPAQRII